MVETHFKDKVSKVFQLVLDEIQIRGKGEVNDPKKRKKRLSERKCFELQNLINLIFLVTAHVHMTSILITLCK